MRSLSLSQMQVSEDAELMVMYTGSCQAESGSAAQDMVLEESVTARIAAPKPGTDEVQSPVR